MIELIRGDVLKTKFTKLPPVNLVVTSPPYNVSIDYDKHKDNMSYKQYLSWSTKWIKKVYNCLDVDGRFCLNIPFSCTPIHLNKKKGEDDTNYPISADITKICQSIGFKFWRVIIWEKNISDKTSWGSWRSASAPFMMDPNECILVFYKNKWKRNIKGTSTISKDEFMKWIKNLWSMRPETNSDHPAPFPLELPTRCIKLFSYKGDIIMDPFMGSGTTGEAAIRLERGFIGTEISKEYFKRAKERIDAALFQNSLIQQIIPSQPVDSNDGDAW